MPGGNDSFDDFDIFGLDEVDEPNNVKTKKPAPVQTENECGTMDGLEEAMLRFTQRTQRGVAVPVDPGESVEPRNDFEKVLADYGLSIKRDENYVPYIYLGDQNHATLVQELDKSLADRQKRDEMVDLFSVALGDKEMLKLYLTPSNSTCGVQDTVFRALLLCLHTQTKVFELLMHHMQILAKKTGDAESENLAVVCVAQLRYLDRVVNSHALFQCIFDRDIEDWSPGPRDTLILAIPEVLTDSLTHMDAAMNLQDMILRRPASEGQSYRTAILGTLRLLRIEGPVARKIRKSLCASVMQFEAPTIPELILFAVETLTVDKKSALVDVLTELASSLKLDELRINRGIRGRVSVDDVVLDIFSRLCRTVQLEGNKGWRDVMVFLRHGKASRAADEDADVSDGSAGEADTTAVNRELAFGLFDIMLSFALLSVDGCPSTVISNLKHQIISQPEEIDRFIDICKIALQFRKFCLRHSGSLTQLARQSLWAVDPAVRRFGAFVYKQLFISIDKTREVVLPAMLSHISKSDGEAEAVFTCIDQLIVTNLEDLLPFVKQLHKCIDLLEDLSINNINRLYNILVCIYTKEKNEVKLKEDVEESIAKFISSVNEREQLWGVLGMLMQFQSLLVNSSPDREKFLKEKIVLLERSTAKSTWLRSVFYEQLAKIFRNNIRSSRSAIVLRWTDKLFETFKKDFFTTRSDDHVSHSELEADNFVRASCNLWLSPPKERLMELVPLFELLKETALLKQRWSTDDDTQMAINNHWTRFFFAFEANIDMTAISTQLTASDEVSRESADILFHVIDWIRMILNTFSCRDSVDDVEPSVLKELWMNKFALMFQCQKQLSFRIKMLKTWILPTLSFQLGQVVVHSEVAKVAVKRTKKNPRKGGKKRKATPTEDEAAAGEEAADADPYRVPSDEEEAGSGREEATPTPEGEEPGTRQTVLYLAQLLEKLRTLKLATVVRLIVLVPDKRRATTFLLDELLRIFHLVMPKRERKMVPWETKTVGEPLDPLFHGDSSAIWKLVVKVLPVVWSVLNRTAEFFRDLLNSSDVSDGNVELLSQLSNLFRLTLVLITTVLSSKEVAPTGKDDGDRATRSRQARRRQLMEKMEHAILQTRSSQEESAEDAEFTLLNYLVECAEIVPRIEVAVALLEAVSNCVAWTPELRETMSGHALQFLKREWRDDESNPLKGTALNTMVKNILDHYIRLRPEKYRLACIQWILANKIAELAPDDERRKSKMSSYEDSGDPGLSESDRRAIFACFTRHTFTGMYKVLFSAVNASIGCRLSSSENLRIGVTSAEQTLKEWQLAANSFCLLGLILRVRELRNVAVLTAATREGKRFLSLFSKNSSFMYILEDQSRFTPVAPQINSIIKSVQLGNRTLQNVSVYAKTMKSSSLLKSLPELRAASELWMRAVHSALVNIDCHQAFEIGLLKSRDMDGEEIRDNDMEEDDESSTERNEEEDTTENQEAGNVTGEEEDEENSRPPSEVY